LTEWSRLEKKKEKKDEKKGEEVPLGKEAAAFFLTERGQH